MRFVTFTLALADECNFISSSAVSTGVEVGDTLGETGTTGDEAEFVEEFG